MGWAGFLRKTWPNYVSPMGRVIEVTTRPWVTHGPGWAGLWAGLMRPRSSLKNLDSSLFLVNSQLLFQLFLLRTHCACLPFRKIYLVVRSSFSPRPFLLR